VRFHLEQIGFGGLSVARVQFSEMFTKSLASLVIIGLFWGSMAVDQYGLYGGSGLSTTERSNAELRCMNINPQNSVDLEQVKGIRYKKLS